MLKELFEKEKHLVNYFFDHLDLQAADQLLQMLIDCKGVVIITGMGKSGLVAEKIALTLTSTGSRAFFLSPSNALHGDIGMVTKDDIFLMISKSGESDELLQLMPFLRNKGVKIVGIVNNAQSRLSRAVDLCVALPMERELCPFDLVPTTSAVTQMLFGDALSIALMTAKKFGLDEYAMNHPGGKIGRRLTLRVKDLMLAEKDLPVCGPNDTLVDTLVELSNKKCGCVMVVNPEKKLMGIFTDGDLRRALQAHGTKALDKPMRDLMTETPRYIQSQEMASKALHLMEADQKRPITALPVLCENNKVVGIIKMHDILQSGL